MLIALGASSDPHLIRVIQALRDFDYPAQLVAYESESTFDVLIDRCGQRHIRLGGQAVPPGFVLWARSKLYPGSSHYPAGFTDFLASEWRAFIASVAATHPNELTFNPLSAELRRCPLKATQQWLAAKVGFNCPTTLITNSQPSALDFARSQKKIVLKAISSAMITDEAHRQDTKSNQSILPMTIALEAEHIMSASPDSIGSCPHYFQERIEKDYELRVVAVGEKTFAFRLDSQRHEISKVDWRKGVGFIEFQPTGIPEELRRLVHAYMILAGIDSGSFDIVVDRQGRNWFLECNVEGAWAWLDDLLKGEITNAFASVIMAKGK